MKKVYAHDGTRALCRLGRTQVRMGHFLSNCCGAEAASPLAKSKWARRVVIGQPAACEGGARKVV